MLSSCAKARYTLQVQHVVTALFHLKALIIVHLQHRGFVGILAELAKSLIHGNIPLAETFDYATALRSLTQGRASYTMEPSFYQEVPGDISSKLGVR